MLAASFSGFDPEQTFQLSKAIQLGDTSEPAPH
jgi:hypothetical protein